MFLTMNHFPQPLTNRRSTEARRHDRAEGNTAGGESPNQHGMAEDNLAKPTYGYTDTSNCRTQIHRIDAHRSVGLMHTDPSDCCTQIRRIDAHRSVGFMHTDPSDFCTQIPRIAAHRSIGLLHTDPSDCCTQIRRIDAQRSVGLLHTDLSD